MKYLYCSYFKKYLAGGLPSPLRVCFTCKATAKRLVISYKNDCISLNTICENKNCLNYFYKSNIDDFIYYLVDCDPIEDAMNKKEEINKCIEKIKKAILLQ